MKPSSLLLTNQWWFVGLFHAEPSGATEAGHRLLGTSQAVTDSLLGNLLQHKSSDLISSLSWSKQGSWCDGTSVIYLSLRLMEKVRYQHSHFLSPFLLFLICGWSSVSLYT